MNSRSLFRANSEALACGAKVIVSNTSSLPEVVGNVGWTVVPTDLDEIESAVCKALDTEFTEYDIEQINEHLKKFDWRKLASQFEEVF